MSTYIHAFGTAVPENSIDQEQVLQFMLRAHQLRDEDAKKLAILYRATGIKKRHSVLRDYTKTDNFDFYPNSPHLDPFPDTGRRQEVYRREAIQLSVKAAMPCLESIDASEITHLITVSCTGMYAPGLDIELVRTLGLANDVKRTAINFMGCYAAFNALKVADAFCNSQENVKVLVVCTELCTLHFQKENSDDNFLANALFADGSAAVLISNQKPERNAMEISHFYSTLEPAGRDEMAWDIGNTGFEMKLSSYVPDFLGKSIEPMLSRLMEFSKMTHFDYFALHPGGKRILQVLEEKLSLTPRQNEFSRSVLKNFGNMSSATILFVLSRIWNSDAMKTDNASILTLAFGPGLTLESMILKIVSHE